MKMITSFDPSAAASGSFDHKVSNPCGGVYLFNESNVWLQLRLPGGHQVGLPAWWSRFYRLDEVLESIQWSELATISTIASPLSAVYGEAYESSELKNRNFYDGPIPRNPYIANQVSSNVSTNQVVNDGNPAVTTVMEATQSGNTGGSNILIGNDGSVTVAQWISGVYTPIFKIVPGASPAIQIMNDQAGFNSAGLIFAPELDLGNLGLIKIKDNAGTQGNILGVDTLGNTFIQAHPTANNIVFYNAAGSITLAKIDSNGNIFANGNNNNKLSNVSFLATPYLFNNSGSLSNGTSVDETVTGGSTGVPTGATGIIVQCFFTSSTVGAYLQFYPQGATVANTSDYPFVITQVSSQIAGGMIIVPVNTSNGKITVKAHQGNCTGIFTSIYGYII